MAVHLLTNHFQPSRIPYFLVGYLAAGSKKCVLRYILKENILVTSKYLLLLAWIIEHFNEEKLSLRHTYCVEIKRRCSVDDTCLSTLLKCSPVKAGESYLH